MRPLRHSLAAHITTKAWWRWQTVAAIAGLMMAGAAFFGALSTYIDERSDVADAASARLRDNRADYEAECRYRISIKVTGIEGQQIDGLTDLLAALAADDGPGARLVVAHLAQLKEDKAEAETQRVGAVETCNAKAREIYPTS